MTAEVLGEARTFAREADVDQEHVSEEEVRCDPRGERGASLVEYALLLALITVVCIGSMQYFSSTNGAGVNRSASCIRAAVDESPMPDNC